MRQLHAWLYLLVVPLLVAGCGTSPNVSLMPTPVVYTELGIGPLDAVPPGERWAPRMVYYATTRERSQGWQRIEYDNRKGEMVRLGAALIGFGTEDLEWEDLRELSSVADRANDEIPLSIAGIVETGRWRIGETPDPEALSVFFSMLNNSIDRASDDELLIYVHGAKVDFYNATAFAAEMDHFMRRDMTAMAFAWPSRQNIVAYGTGMDVARAYRSAESLTDLLEMLARHSDAEKINIVSWSAGGRLVTRALKTLSERHPELSSAEWTRRFRIGTVYYAASDVPRAEFLDELDALERVSDRIIVTVTDNDGALKLARRFMGGGYRLGDRRGELSPGQFEQLMEAESLEVIDVSMGAQERGFDISGHRYWLDHPWASNDVLLAVRSDLRPEERGLVQSELPFLWFIPPDYPQRLRQSMLRPDLEMRAPE
ncbi:MAG: alpha/beta hydrolase [Pseudomonadota bacterium]